MKKLIFTTILFLCASFSYTILAQSAQLSVQGVLRKSNGTAVENGQFQVTFKLWDAATGGNLIWEETKTNVDIEGGIYSVTLGDGATPLDAPFDQPYYLGVAVESGTELIPRAKLTSSPYALSLVGSDNVFPNSGNVGVGANGTEATSKLTVKDGNGVIGIEPGTSANFTAKINTTSNGVNFVNPAGKDYTFSDANNTGNLGIGTTSPTNKLHLKGNGQMLFLEGSDHAYMAFGRNSTSRSGYFGYGGTDPTLTLNNEVGETHVKGSNVRMTPTSGNTGVESDLFVNGTFRVNGYNARARLYGTNSAYIGFYPHADERKAYFGFTGSGNNFSFINTSSGNIDIKTTSGDIYIDPITSSRTIFLDGFVKARGSHDLTLNDYLYLYAHLTNSNAKYHPGHVTATTYAYSIEASQGIKAPRFHQKSDRRIKKDLRISEGKADLALLKTIEVTDYRHIDEVKEGKTFTKGLIAQQVESVFPQAIKKGKECIPNVFSFPKNISLNGATAQFDLAKAHDFKAGDKVKMLTDDGETFFTVASIVNEKSFTISDWKGSDEADKLFVYGKEVDDFRTVDYDHVFTLAVSATQELARKVEALEKENARLKTVNSDSKKANNVLKAEVNSLSNRMEKLEGIFNATGSN